MALLAVGNTASIFVPGNIVTGTDYVLSALAGVAFGLLLLVALLFVDRNITVLRENDFFHRDPLHWSRVRRALIVAMVVSSVEVIGISFIPNPSYLVTAVVFLTYFPIIGVALSYAATALVVAAKRSPSKNLRRFSLLLGISLAFGTLASTIWYPLSFITSTDLENLIASLPNLASAFVLYWTALALSPLGRVDRDL